MPSVPSRSAKAIRIGQQVILSSPIQCCPGFVSAQLADSD